jgi:hypothetical protein
MLTGGVGKCRRGDGVRRMTGALWGKGRIMDLCRLWVRSGPGPVRGVLEGSLLMQMAHFAAPDVGPEVELRSVVGV